MADPVSKIRKDHQAKRSSGTRPLGAIKWIVIHDAEVDDPKLGAEKVADYFASAAARGSTHFSVDNDSTQRHLPDSAIPWGAPGANTNGLHIEHMGKASHSHTQWLEHHGPMFDRSGWLIAHLAKKYDIPLRLLSIAEYRAGRKGIVTHRIISAADGPGGSTHTDPGPHFPIDVLLAKARKYASITTKPKPKPQPFPLPEGHIFARDIKRVPNRHDGTESRRDHDCVVRIQRAVGAAVTGKYTMDTADHVKAYQEKHGLEADTLVGPETWRHITKG